MFEVTIREILPDGSRVPLVHDGSEIKIPDLDGLALLGIISDDGVHSEVCTTLLNISPANIADMLIHGSESLKTGAVLASVSLIRGYKDEELRSRREEDATDATE